MESKENLICIVCHKNPIEYRVMPCRHAYLCKKCSMKMASGGKCKICHEFFVECKRILPGGIYVQYIIKLPLLVLAILIIL